LGAIAGDVSVTDPGHPQDRINMARARGIVGLSTRVMQQMAEAGEIPSAIKIRHRWTFIEAEVRAWLEKLETEQRLARKAGADVSTRRIPSGAATPYGGASASRGRSGAGRYGQAMSTLLGNASRRTSSG
jgi:predicted DNA-binding transcriptional regulator AlpA